MSPSKIAKVFREGRKKKFDPEPFIARVRGLVHCPRSWLDGSPQ